MSKDPIVHLGLSQSPNSYGYVWNNPLAFTDPSGYLPASIKQLDVRQVSEDQEARWDQRSYEWQRMVAQNGGNIPEACWTMRCTYDRLLSGFTGVSGPVSLGSARSGLTSDAIDDYQLRGAERWGDADEIVVIATRLTGNERYEWEQYLGLPPGASLIRATLPDGRVGGVASIASDRSASVGPPATPVSHSMAPGETATAYGAAITSAGSIGTFVVQETATYSGYFGAARLASYSGGVLGITGAVISASQGDYLSAVVDVSLVAAAGTAAVLGYPAIATGIGVAAIGYGVVRIATSP